VVHPVSFDLAKFTCTPVGAATPAAAEQSLHLVHTVLDEPEHALDVYVPLAHAEHFVHTVFDDAVHALEV